MGITILVGCGKMNENGAPVVVEKSINGAPVFPDSNKNGFTDSSNRRAFSYHAWAYFGESSGLTDLLERVEISGHPGIFNLVDGDLARINQALEVYQVRYPDIAPAFGESDEAADLARLLWLRWWVKWALDTCESPALYNR